MSWLGIVLTFSLAENVLLVHLLGLVPSDAAPAEPGRTAAAGLAVTFLAGASAAAAWVLRRLVLDPLGLAWLQTPGFVLAVVGIATLGRLALRAFAPRAGDLFGPVLRPSGASAAALGTVLVAARAGFGLVEGLAAGLASGAGFLVAVSILSGVAGRLEPGEAPSSMRGLPLSLVSAGLAALAFAAFDHALIARLVP